MEQYERPTVSYILMLNLIFHKFNLKRNTVAQRQHILMPALEDSKIQKFLEEFYVESVLYIIQRTQNILYISVPAYTKMFQNIMIKN